MKTIKTIIIALVFSTLLFGCEKEYDLTTTHNISCKERLDAHIKLWDSLCGHCGCPSPEEYNVTDVYHIDTQEGLNEFARVITPLTTIP